MTGRAMETPSVLSVLPCRKAKPPTVSVLYALCEQPIEYCGGHDIRGTHLNGLFANLDQTIEAFHSTAKHGSPLVKDYVRPVLQSG